MSFGKKNYAFPKEDVLEIDAVNITSEELARYFARQIQASFSKHKELSRINALTVGVQETRGQTVFYDADLVTRL